MSTNGKDNKGAPSPVETIKERGDYLRGGIARGLADDLTGGVAEDDQSLIKFHGIYQQDDRDIRAARAARKLEPDYTFMIRLRVPSGLMTPAQWLAADFAAAELTEAGSIRLTTRQTLQFHGVPKENLRPLLKTCARRLLDSIAACGDVNRNVMCSPHAGLSAAHAAAHETARHISEFLLPRSRAYYEIWLGEEKIASSPARSPQTAEPLYGRHYLPRKFKIAVAVPPANDVDVYSQDIGFVAVVRGGKLRGFNVLAGGGLGMTHGDRRTYPRLASPLGFCAPSQAAEVAWHIAALQRDFGDRSDRKQARFKYTTDRLGLDFVREELARRLGFVMPPPEEVKFSRRADVLGWQQQPRGWDLTLYIENGRIKGELKDALREVAALDCCGFLMTPNQNLTLVNISEQNRARVENVFARRHVGVDFSRLSGLRKNAMACVALPTCPLAFAEAERYLPSLTEKLEAELAKHGLQKDDISIRMTGCPNGCARPYLGEIGLVGKAPGRYNLYLGASATGERLSAIAGNALNEPEILAALSPLFAAYAETRENGESFGDFLVRTKKARAPQNAADFHP